MKETLLKKPFKESDIQRMRNILSGNFGDKTKTQSGWEKVKQHHGEGDTWEENGKTWTIKNGIKQNVTRLDALKQLVLFPISCPKCKKSMKNHELNKKMYSIHGTCIDCVVEKEQQIKLQGKWEEYEQSIMKGNQREFLKDLEQALDSWYNEKDNYVSEQGDTETWLGGDKKDAYERLKEQLSEIKSEQH